MALKSLRLARAEDLPEKTRAEFGLPAFGLVAIETKNPELKENMIFLKDGFSAYLRTLGDFKEVEIAEPTA
jgi:hypothetical protein